MDAQFRLCRTNGQTRDVAHVGPHIQSSAWSRTVSDVGSHSRCQPAKKAIVWELDSLTRFLR